MNADAPRSLAKGCQQLDIPLFHISTDYVFDGIKDEPYVETDLVNPVNAYGRTKLAGELAIKEETHKHVIIRTSWVFSKDGKNFVNTILRLAKERDQLKVVDDQYGGPSSVEGIVKALLTITSHYKQNNEIVWGNYHYCQKPYVSWHLFAKAIVERAIDLGLINHKVEVASINSSKFPSRVNRPANARLATKKYETVFGKEESCWNTDLKNLLYSLSTHV